jgi:hypothetical protein
MKSDQPGRLCAHEPCTCTVPTGQDYCSAICRHNATSGVPRSEPACECDHPDCAGRSRHAG